MRIKRFKNGLMTVALCLGLCAGLAGCGENEIPEMTDEQMKAVGEYVAIIMMKYDANHKSRLVDLAAIPPEPAATPQPTLEPEKEKEPSGMGPVDNTPVIDTTGNNSRSIEEVLGLPEGIRLVYSGQEICASYPNGGDMVVSLSATKGKKLLVLKYMLVNSGEQEQELNLFSTDAFFRITVNGDYSRNALKSWIPGDLLTFEGKIAGNSSAEAAILVEIDENMASGVNTISINVKNGEKAYTTQIL